MFQKEQADRIMAKTKTKDYGRISVISQWLCNIKRKMNLTPNYFFPKPKIDSSILEFEFKRNIKKVNNEDLFINLIKKCFEQRRKTVRNNLKKTSPSIDQILMDCKIDGNKRAEELDFNDYINLSNSFINKKRII